MAEKLQMLALSPTMEEGTIVKWLVKEGDTISGGDALCEVETDKAVMEYASPADGTLLKIVVGEGGGAKIGDVIGVAGEPGEDIADLLAEASAPAAAPAAPTPEAKPAAPPAAPAPAPTPAAAAPTPTPAPTSVSAPPAPEGKDGKIRSTPIARRMAEQHDLDLRQIEGSGPLGRITKRDVQKAIDNNTARIVAGQGSAAPAETVTIPVSNARRVIAERLTQSKYNSPHFYMKVTAIMDELMNARKMLNQRMKLKVSFNAFIVKLVAMALKHHKLINASWTEDKIIQHGRVDIALAVALEDGLITPVVRNCANKGILEIDEELQDLIARARERRLDPSEYQNSTFTISNLGSYGIEEFSAIINPPNSAILALGTTQRTPIVGENDEIKIHSAMQMTMSYDHRVIDGVVGAAFLTDLKGMLEYPVQSLY